MNILFLGDKSQNSISWINEMENNKSIKVVTWSLSNPGRGLLSRFKRSFNMIFSPFHVNKLIKDFKPDIVIAYRITSYGFISALTNFKPSIVVGQGASDLWPLNSPVLFFKKIMLQFSIYKADLIHVWAEHMGKNLIALGADKNNIFVMPRGINLALFLKPNLSYSNDETLEIVCTRSLYAEYGHELVLEVLNILNLRYKIKFKCTFIGDGPLIGRLKIMSYHYKLSDKITFSGKVGNSIIPNILSKSHIYLSLPSTEGLSASLLESMASGCFPIVSDLPGNQAVINNGENGYLVDRKKTENIANIIFSVWNDKKFRKSSSKKNISLVKKKYDIEKNIKMFMVEYSKLTNDDGTKR
jgi:glycosyltransferase involved in cell wall biosynthesis